MSETVRELKGITPILQSLLINQISKVMAALDEANHLKAWFCLRDLVIASPPKVNEKCIEDVRQIQKQINKICKGQGVDVAIAQRDRRRELAKFLRGEVLPLFEKVMDSLYKGQYLESYREYSRGREIGY